MGNGIIKPNGEYIQTSFSGPKGEWRLSSSKSDGHSAMETIDTFRCNGKFVDIKRKKVYHMAQDKAIWA